MGSLGGKGGKGGGGGGGGGGAGGGAHGAVRTDFTTATAVTAQLERLDAKDVISTLDKPSKLIFCLIASMGMPKRSIFRYFSKLDDNGAVHSGEEIRHVSFDLETTHGIVSNRFI
jgi:hypothetical protein